MSRSLLLSLIGAASFGLLVAGAPPACAQVVCGLSGQQGGSFIGGGTAPFTVQSTGKENCRGLNKPDATSQLEFGSTLGADTADCPGAGIYEYPLVNGSFVIAQANSGGGSKDTTTISGTYTPGTSYVCFNENVSPVTTHGSFEATVTGGTGVWAGASGTFSVVADGTVVQSFSNGIVQMSFLAQSTGTIQHP